VMAEFAGADHRGPRTADRPTGPGCGSSRRWRPRSREASRTARGSRSHPGWRKRHGGEQMIKGQRLPGHGGAGTIAGSTIVDQLVRQAAEVIGWTTWFRGRPGESGRRAGGGKVRLRRGRTYGPRLVTSLMTARPASSTRPRSGSRNAPTGAQARARRCWSKATIRGGPRRPADDGVSKVAPRRRASVYGWPGVGVRTGVPTTEQQPLRNDTLYGRRDVQRGHAAQIRAMRASNTWRCGTSTCTASGWTSTGC